MMEVTLVGAFLGGLLSFLSPCVLPLVPPYLSYIAGLSYGEVTAENRHVGGTVLLSAVLFVLGFATIFIAFGATASLFGQVISENAGILTKIAGALIIIFGFHFLGIVRIPLLYREARMEGGGKAGYLGAYLMGLAFAFGWTPCVGPILAAILFMAGGQETVWDGIWLLGAYAAGIGIPFILAAAFTAHFVSWSKGFKRHLGVIEKVSGVFLVATGLLFLFGGMDDLGFWLLELFPSLGRIG